MNKMLVAVFDKENNAYEGLSALKDLHRLGDITLYASVVVSKDENGSLHIKTSADEGPVGTATGLFAGSLIGLLGGPVGLAIGATAGTMAGLFYDLDTDDINSAFVEEVSGALTKGTTAIIAEIDETWTVPVDLSLEALNGMVFRRQRYEVAEEQLIRESEAIDTEMNNLKEELKEARAEDKAAIKAAMAKLEGKAKAINDQVQKRLSETRSQMDSKLHSMQQQLKHAGEKRKARMESRMHDVKEGYQARAEKLKQASKLIGKAFGPAKEIEEAVI